jgi:hypothetical protein
MILILFFSSPVFGEEGESITSSLFNREHLNVFVVLVIFSSFFFFFIFTSRRGGALYLRKIPGITAIEEAVGRATEMGRPVLFVPGLDDIDEIQTLAAIGVLGHVAKITARYDTPLIVPTRRSIVLSVCEETVKESYTAAGRPDAYKADNLRYLSDEQFAYTAGVDGIMMREKPAANIYMGTFYAESLILAETGFSSGAIQVAGTASITQLPFFVAACDYTLLSEEFYAASAYLSKDPQMLSSVKASDYFKIISITVLIAGAILATLKPEWVPMLQNWF